MKDVRFRRQRTATLITVAAVAALLLLSPLPAAADSLDEIGPQPQVEFTGGGSTRAVPPTNVAIFQDDTPWGYTVNTDILTAHAVPYTIYTSSDIGVVDLTPFDKVVIPSVQPLAFYSTVSANVAWFEAFANGGGTLEFHGCPQPSTDWSAMPMPGGLTIEPLSNYPFTNALTVSDPGHPLASDPNILDDTLIDNWGASAHTFFTGAGGPFASVIEDDVSTQPVMLEMAMGSGCMLASTMTLEYGAGFIGYADPLENMLLRTCDEPVGAVDVLLVVADGSASLLTASLSGYADIGTVDYYDARIATPTLAELQAYDAVVTYSNSTYSDPVSLGDVLADFVDAGGTVILCTPAFYSGYAVAGRIAGPTYSPYVGTGSHFAYASLGTTTPGCIMDGITAATDYFRDIVDLQGGPTVWAYWDDGEEYVAQIDGVKVVGITNFPGDNRDSSGQVDEVIHNAIVCNAGATQTAQMFALDETTNSLYGIAPATGATALVGACVEDLSGSGMAYDSTNATMFVSDVTMAGGLWGLGSVDLATGVVTIIGDHVTTTAIVGLAYNPTIDVLYGADWNTAVLTTIDRATGAATAVGPWGGALLGAVCGLAYDQDAGVLYASDQNNLYTVDEATGTVTLVGAHGLAFPYAWCALEYNPNTGMLYVAGGGQADLFTLDMTTAAATSVGPTGLSLLSGMGTVIGGPTTGTLSGQLSFTPDLMGTDPSGFLIEATPLGGGSPITTLTDGTGNWTMDVPEGIYDVTATSLDWLGAFYAGAMVTAGAPTVLSNPTLLGGDFDDSGDVGVVDVTYVSSRYGGGDLTADINRSGDVGLVDVTSTASNYGSDAPVPWP